MIISLSGKLRSGKDTVAKMIQYLTSECGNKEGPKYRTFEKFLQHDGGSNPRTFDFHYQSEWEIHKFAHKLKEIAGILLGNPNFEYRWENGNDEYRNEFLPEWGMTRREFLQRLGTDSVRDGLHTDAWVIATLADYKSTTNRIKDGFIPCGSYYIKEEDFNRNRDFSKCTEYSEKVATILEYPKWIISDTRFPNEIEAIRNKGGIAVRVNRSAENRSVDLSIPEHASETSLDNYRFDYELDNNSSIERLQRQVYNILKECNLLQVKSASEIIMNKLDGKYITEIDPYKHYPVTIPEAYNRINES